MVAGLAGARRIDAEEYCPECGQSLRLAPRQASEAAPGRRWWPWLLVLVGVALLAAGGPRAWAAERALRGTDTKVLTLVTPGQRLLLDPENQSLRRATATSADLREHDWVLVERHQAQQGLDRGLSELSIGLGALLLGASGVIRLRVLASQPARSGLAIHLWDSAERLGLSLAVLLLALVAAISAVALATGAMPSAALFESALFLVLDALRAAATFILANLPDAT